MKNIKAILVVVLLFASFLFGCSSSDSQFGCSSSDSQSDAVGRNKTQTAQQTTPSQTEPASTQPDPETTGALFEAYDINGSIRSSNEWIGKQPVVVNFWGTWCPPCRREIPDLIRLYDEYRYQGVEMLGLAVKDNAQQAAGFARQAGMQWVMMVANKDILSEYQIASVPTTIFYDRQGNQVLRLKGLRNYEELKQGFEAIAGS